MGLKQKAGAILLVVFFAVLVVALFNATGFSIEAFQFTVELDFSNHGVTEISIPPLGSVSAATHKTPVKIKLTLESIDLDSLGSFLANVKEQQELLEIFRTKGLSILRLYVLKLMALAFLGGVAGAILLRSHKLSVYLRSGLLGMLLMTVLLIGTYNTYELEQFNSPQFNGALQAAPWMINLAEEALARIEDLSNQMEGMAGNLYTMFEQIETIGTIENASSDVRILHVSDIHNNPVAMDLVKQIVNSFHVDFVIDTGDLSDYGTALEGLLTQKLEELPVPYVFIPGNHDSPATLEALQRNDNVIILDEEVAVVEGISIFGLADPASFGSQLISDSDEKYPGYNDEIKQLLSTLSVDIVAVHRPSVAKSLMGFSPVILYGHDHSYNIETIQDTVLIDAGSTGAAGIRGLQISGEVPYSMVLLHMDDDNGTWVPSVADIFTFFGGTSRVSLERRLFVH